MCRSKHFLPFPALGYRAGVHASSSQCLELTPSSWSELIKFYVLHPCPLAAAVFEFIAFGFLVSHFCPGASSAGAPVIPRAEDMPLFSPGLFSSSSSCAANGPARPVAKPVAKPVGRPKAAVRPRAARPAPKRTESRSATRPQSRPGSIAPKPAPPCSDVTSWGFWCSGEEQVFS